MYNKEYLEEIRAAVHLLETDGRAAAVAAEVLSTDGYHPSLEALTVLDAIRAQGGEYPYDVCKEHMLAALGRAVLIAIDDDEDGVSVLSALLRDWC